MAHAPAVPARSAGGDHSEHIGEIRNGRTRAARKSRRCGWRRPRPSPSRTWRAFLEAHLREIVAIDFFVVPTLTFRLLFAFIVLRHDRRQLVDVMCPPRFGSSSVRRYVARRSCTAEGFAPLKPCAAGGAATQFKLSPATHHFRPFPRRSNGGRAWSLSRSGRCFVDRHAPGPVVGPSVASSSHVGHPAPEPVKPALASSVGASE